MSLLPINATPQEQALSDAIERAFSLDVPIPDVWNPDTCPVDYLPWLAFAFSVDEWDPTWTEEAKRVAIKSSVPLHRKKGTVGAVKRALAPYGAAAVLVEWFDMTPQGSPFTFEVLVSQDLTAEQTESLNRAIQAAKPVSRHYSVVTGFDYVADTYMGVEATTWAREHTRIEASN